MWTPGKTSIVPYGIHSIFFKNFWTTIRKHLETTSGSLPDVILDEALDDFEASSIEEGQEIKEILKCRANLESEAFLKQWPRLLDTPGAIQQDFQLSYHLFADNRSSKWTEIAPNILEYFKSMNFGTLGEEHDVLTLAFFALHLPKAKNVTQGDSVKSFLDVTHVSSH
ncbi:unnamed protein product [Allacma fusca]|uniref:Uncharacterized protein n=1 Tax=Allacma fusca TaxID=39272 RepID=A0A8J2K2T7_9HEXA|nr:unnamed protein product [Allacma fusca]